MGALLVFAAASALLTYASLSSATKIGECYLDPKCTPSSKTGDINATLNGNPEVFLFQVNCPSYHATAGLPEYHGIKVCQTIDITLKECTDCVEAKRGECLPVDPLMQWVGICIG